MLEETPIYIIGDTDIAHGIITRVNECVNGEVEVEVMMRYSIHWYISYQVYPARGVDSTA